MDKLLWIMLMSTFRTLVNNSVKKKFYEKRKKNNYDSFFFIFHKSNIKTFLKWIVNQYFKDTLISISQLLLEKLL